MSMTKSEFTSLCRGAMYERNTAIPIIDRIVKIVEKAGIEWEPEPTPEPTGDLTMTRIIDAKGNTWRNETLGWVRLGFVYHIKAWSEVPQPATVLRPET